MKIVKLFVAIITSTFITFVEAGWTTTEIKEKYKKFPSECLILDSPACFYGSKSGSIWTPADIQTPDSGLTYCMVGDPYITSCYTFTDVLEFGTYDDASSLNKWFAKFERTISDDYETYTGYMVVQGETEYRILDSQIKNTFEEQLTANTKLATAVIAEVEKDVEKWLEEKKADAGGTTDGVSEETAKEIKDVKEAIDEQEEHLEEQAKEMQKQAEAVKEDLREAEIDASKYDGEAAKKAGEDISNALALLDQTMAEVEAAIDAEDFNALSGANATIDAMIQQLTDAVAELNGLDGDGYQELRDTLNQAISTMSNAKANIIIAINTKDWSKARAALASMRGLNRLADAKKRLRHAELKRIIAQGKVLKEEDRLAVVMALIAQYLEMDEAFIQLRNRINMLVVRYMTDMNAIGAYLGSTNAMQYFSERRKLEEMTPDEILRWFGFSAPDKIDENYGFGSSTIGGKKWNFVFDTFASTYSLWAWPLVEYEGEMVSGYINFMNHYGLSGMAPKYNGFEEKIDYPGNVTNWYAKSIGAPKNWADGTTVIVTNGQFKVNGMTTVKTLCPPSSHETHQGETFVTEASGKLVFRSAENSNVTVDISTNAVGDVFVTFGVLWK